MELKIKKAYSYIRFSSRIQAHGDSERRQGSRVEEIATKLTLPLDNTLALTDRGLSSWKGDNLTKGALGEFLKLVDKNEIAVGSCLIIEHFDRLTRQGMVEAIHLLTGILLKGIDIYTVMDDKHFTRDSFNAVDLIISAISLQEGHIESEKKSERLRETYQNKRNTLSEKRKLTSKCPSWLKPKGYMEGKKFICTHYVENPIAVPVIKEIFRMRLDYGYGRDKIARELNIKGVWTPPGRISRRENKASLPASWRASYIDKILRNNRAVLGEYQPHKMVDGKRVPDGEVQLNYFPQIIDNETYNRTHATFPPLDKSKKHAGGRNGKVTNLFSGYTYCVVCGFPIQYINKGNTSKGGQTLNCDKALREVDSGCTKAKIKYDLFEEKILTYCLGLDVSEIVPNSKERLKELTELQKHLQAIEGELVDVDRKIANLEETIGDTPDRGVRLTLSNTLSRHLDSKRILNERKTKVEGDIFEFTNSTTYAELQLKDIQELISRMKELDGQERTDLRLSLRNQLRRLIDKIVVNLEAKKISLIFHSGAHFIYNLSTGKGMYAFPKSAGFTKTDKGYIKTQ